MNSGDAWFANASINGTSFKFLMDTGVSKSVMSLRRFMSIPDLFRPQLYNTRMRFQVANAEVISFIGVAHVTIQMYGYMFNLPIFVCDLGEIDCIFGWTLERKQSSLHVHEQAGFGSMLINRMNQNNCLGAIAMLYVIFDQFRELNLNVQSDNCRSSLCKENHVQKMEWITGPL